LLSRTAAKTNRVIRLDLEKGSEVKKVRVRLSAEQYEQAIEAHHNDSHLSVSGTLDREGTLYWLYNPQNVSIVVPSGGTRTDEATLSLFDEDTDL
jgi:hypothetical protein